MHSKMYIHSHKYFLAFLIRKNHILAAVLLKLERQGSLFCLSVHRPKVWNIFKTFINACMFFCYLENFWGLGLLFLMYTEFTFPKCIQQSYNDP